ncbi:MAG TPA: hypothetical protein PLD59_06775 [Tepidisphaeraceae bacterium]|nr:hypothetical protein [Tepidisphaeraceae bacterium]
MSEPEQLDFEEELSKAQFAQPFVPFTIVTASGDRYHVPSPHWIAFGEDVVIVLRPEWVLLRFSFTTSLQLRLMNVLDVTRASCPAATS